MRKAILVLLLTHIGFNLAGCTPVLTPHLTNQIITWLGFSLLGGLLFLLPGWGLGALLYPEWSVVSIGSKIGLSSALSLALYPHLLLWSHLINWQPGVLLAWIPPLIGVLSLAWQALHSQRKWAQTSINNFHIKHHLPELTLLILVCGLIFTRFYAVRSITLPAWGDGLHHTFITALLVENRGLFSDWAPYAELKSLDYHYGFHAAAAAFKWLSGVDAAQATLATGQLFNILAVLALIPLAKKIYPSRWSGVLAVMLAGFGFQMPLYYANWSRFTQLAGQVILPAGIVLIGEYFEQSGRDNRRLGLALLAMSGLGLTHMRVLIFGLLFVPIAFLLNWHPSRTRLLLSKTILLSGLLAGILLPRLLQILNANFFTFFTQLVTSSPTSVQAVATSDPIGDLRFFLPVWGWLLASLGLGWLLWRHRIWAAMLGGWSLLILLAANPDWLRLPGTGVLSNFAIFIAAYIPGAVLVGATLAFLLGRIENHLSSALQHGRWHQPVLYRTLLASLVVLLAIAGAYRYRHTFNPQLANLVTSSDLEAAEWISSHTLPDSLFLINGFLAYNGTTAVGSDAGWWLPYTAQRSVTLPPILYGTEAELYPGYYEHVKELVEAVYTLGPEHLEYIRLLAERGVDYVYIGQLHGSHNAPQPSPLIPELLEGDPHYQLVYQLDQVWIFKFIP